MCHIMNLSLNYGVYGFFPLYHPKRSILACTASVKLDSHSKDQQHQLYCTEHMFSNILKLGLIFKIILNWDPSFLDPLYC